MRQSGHNDPTLVEGLNIEKNGKNHLLNECLSCLVKYISYTGNLLRRLL